MKTKSKDARPILFPVTGHASTLAAEALPSFPAFPVGREPGWLFVAVPSLVILPVDAFTDESQERAVADAVDLLKEGEIRLAGVPIECRPLCDKFPSGNCPTSETRAELLRLLMATARSWAADVAEASDRRKAEDAGKASAEILALLSLFQPAGLHDSPVTIG